MNWKFGELKQPGKNLMEEKQSVTDEFMEYKDLVDEKIITEEEFNIKKKELLREINK